MKKHRALLSVIAAILLAALAGGGCGGGSSSSGIREERVLDLERSFSEGLPPFFLIDGAGDPIVLKASDKPALKPGVYPAPVEVPVPAQLRGVIRPSVSIPLASTSSVKAMDDAASSYLLHDRDTFKAHLSKGVRYSAEVSRNLGEPLGTFIPEISIYDPDGKLISGSAHELIVAAEPAEDPSVVVRSFVPDKDGVWTITLEDAGKRHSKKNANTAYILRLYQENGKDDEVGHPTRYIVGKQTLSLRDVMKLRRAAHGVNVLGASKFVQDPIDGGNFQSVLPNIKTGDENHTAMMKHFNSIKARESVADANRTQLEPWVSDVPFDSKMTNGIGFIATTGKLSTGTAIDKFDLPGGLQAPESVYRSTFISTKEEHEEELGIKTEASFSSAENSVNASMEYSSGIKYSLTSTTLVVHYHKWDSEYKRPDNYTISDKALDELKTQGYDKWRDTYGDYFLAGRRMGAQIDAYIAITAESNEEIENVKAAMAGKSPSISGSAEFTEALKDAVSSCNVKVEIRKRGDVGTKNDVPDGVVVVSHDLSDGSTSIDDIMSQVDDFVKAAQSDSFKFVTLDVLLGSYAAASNAGDLIPDDIPVDPNCFVEIRNFVTEMLGLAAYYNDISAIPDSSVYDVNVTKAGWKKDYDDLMQTIDSQLDDICSSTDSIDKYTSQIEDLSEKYRKLSERWYFYSKLLEAQKSQPNSGYVTCGYNGFAISQTVDDDFQDMVSEHYNKDWHIGWREWEPNRVTDPDSLVWAYFKISYASWVTTDNDPECKDRPTLGKNRFHWYLKSNYDRGAEWFIDMRAIDLSDKSKYPFVGL